MIIDLKQDQKIKLKRLFEKKNYSKFENQVEKLGSIEDLPIYLRMGYAGSKVLNPNSKKDDFLNATIIFEKIYSKDKSNLEALYNLILSSLKSEICSYVLPHLLDFYKKNKKNPKIVEGLARVYFQLDNMDLSVKFFKKLIDLNPISTIDGGRLTYLASMNYPSNINQKDYYNECIKLGDAFEKYSKFQTYVDNTSLNKKVKIGFLSGDFRDHSVNFFLKDIIKKIDKKKFFIIGLSNLELKRHHEVITKFYQNQFNEWHNIIDYNDEKLVKFVRSLNLDVLIDLNGFTFGNRLNIFAARSAKKQISWCGYNNSLGIKNMDYLIADKNLIKKNEKKYYKEKIIYMPKIWNAMSKPENLPEINDLPFKKSDIFRFGSFNSFKKISDDVIKVWSKIINNSNCELYLKNSGGYNKEIYDNLLMRFKNENADTKKIIFLKKSKNTEFMKDYYKIDLALDTFPYTGVTTSFQSYLMGVPVLTLKGFNLNSRCGESINANLGLNDFIGENHNDYYKKSIVLQDKKKLSNLRSSLRKKVLGSSLFDTDNFTKDISNVFEKILKQ
jgi:protein O-GlcNAc transferase